MVAFKEQKKAIMYFTDDAADGNALDILIIFIHINLSKIIYYIKYTVES